MLQVNRQLYPDFLRATSIAKIVMFHFFGWQLLTYMPALGIMFALGGWFVANSLNNKPILTVIYNRLMRLLPTWWAFAILTFGAGFFYAQGAKISLDTSLAWIFPYQAIWWNLDNAYANGAVAVTWYIAAYLGLLLLSPVLLHVYKKLSWVSIAIPIIGMVVYTKYFPLPENAFQGNLYSILTFGGCWMLGFTKADKSIDNVNRYIIWAIAAVCVAFGIFSTYEIHELSTDSNAVATSIMSFGIAMLLLSCNLNLSELPSWVKNTISWFNKYAVTIYLFHNIAINFAFVIGDHVGVYAVGDYLKLYNYDGHIGQVLCFMISLVLVYLITKTIGIVEVYNWGGKKVP